MIADGVLGVILLCMMLVWSALLIYAARRDVKTSRITTRTRARTRGSWPRKCCASWTGAMRNADQHDQ